MQNFLIQPKGRAVRRPSSASVSAQNSHSGRSIWEQAQKYTTAPPRAPRTMNPRSSPSPRSSRKVKDAAPTPRQ
nr:hypothetical protein [uncultured Dysosmobacter sp.]